MDSSPHSDLEIVRRILNEGVPMGFSLALEALDSIEEQLEAAQRVVQLVVRYDEAVLAWDNMKAHDTETQKAKNRASNEAGRLCDEMIAAAREASIPASRPLDPKFPHHIEGCICPRFKDIAPDLIADLTCPVHGVNGTNPGDVLSERSPAKSLSG